MGFKRVHVKMRYRLSSRRLNFNGIVCQKKASRPQKVLGVVFTLVSLHKETVHCSTWPSNGHSPVVDRTEEMQSAADMRFGAVKHGSNMGKHIPIQQTVRQLPAALKEDHFSANPHGRTVEYREGKLEFCEPRLSLSMAKGVN